jgi:pectinesterase
MKNITTLIFTFFFPVALLAAGEADIVVSKDGTGDFTTIMEAVNSIPANNDAWKTIRIKNGVYDEHVMIKNNFIALAGEDRYLTQIEHNLARKEWNAANGSNTGCGVINIWTNCHDIVIANMTVKNTYNYTSDSGEDYTEVIRSETGTTRIWVVNSDILCKWKDTFALWGKDNGMYYVNNCTFRGSIDAFCPRGWCYALNCRFIETRDSSPVWMEGVSGLNQKLVVQGGSVHSEKNKKTKLQNQQGSPSFYYLDVALSDSIGSQGSSGPSYYYRVSGNSSYTWFADNISLEQRKQIDSQWTFTSNNTLMWSPEDEMPPVLPFASLPQPYHKRYEVNPGKNALKWIAGKNALSHRVYLGVTDNPPFYSETSAANIQVDLEAGKTYYWRVDVVTGSDVVAGETWSFSTAVSGNTTGIQMIEPDCPVLSVEYFNPAGMKVPRTENQLLIRKTTYQNKQVLMEKTIF